MREAGLPGRRLLVKTKIKRLLAIMMFVAVPLVSASPTSALQEVTTPVVVSVPAPTVAETSMIEKELPVFFGTASWYSESDPDHRLR